MKIFWDTSAAINAAVSTKVNARLETDEHFARLHLFHEFFSTMTGRGVQARDGSGAPLLVVFDPDDAAKWLRQFAQKVSLVELTGPETLDALDKAQSQNVQGGKVYDYAHAVAADKAGADEVLTRNTDHFKGLTKARVVWP